MPHETSHETMLYESFARDYLVKLADLLPRLDVARIAQAIGWLRDARDAGRTIFACGNGGSGAIASELVGELVKFCSVGRPRRFRAICLSDNVSALTACANDEGYEQVFAEPLKNFAQRGDLLIAISGSGNSRNVLTAVETAKELGVRTIALTNGEGGRLREIADLPLLVPASHMGRLEDCFFITTHILCYAFVDGPPDRRPTIPAAPSEE
ncbi:MAG: SIS domain-containing protein [Planctomycetales bacterium]